MNISQSGISQVGVVHLLHKTSAATCSPLAAIKLGAMSLQLTHAVLAICLNLGTPQGLRTKTEEAFFDPSTRKHERSMRKIMQNLVNSVEQLQELSILAVSAWATYVSKRCLH